MIKQTIFFLLILANTVWAKELDLKQLFNKQTVKMTNEELVFSKSYYGITSLDESKTVDIVSRFDGYITHLNANKNFMSVKKDDLLYSIYSPEISKIATEYNIAKNIDKDLSQNILKQYENYGIKSNSKSKNIDVVSPINGVIIEKNINNNSYVEKGKTLFKIANIEKLWFIATVYQDDLKDIKKDLSAKITLDGHQKIVDAKVDFIYPILNSDRTLNIRFEVDNSDLKLYSSMFGKVEIIFSKNSFNTVPKSSIIERNNEFWVFKALKDGKYEPKKVEARKLNDEKYEIISGLNADDEIINESLFLLDADAMTNRLYEDDDEDW